MLSDKIDVERGTVKEKGPDHPHNVVVLAWSGFPYGIYVQIVTIHQDLFVDQQIAPYGNGREDSKNFLKINIKVEKRIRPRNWKPTVVEHAPHT